MDDGWRSLPLEDALGPADARLVMTHAGVILGEPTIGNLCSFLRVHALTACRGIGPTTADRIIGAALDFFDARPELPRPPIFKGKTTLGAPQDSPLTGMPPKGRIG